MQILIFGAGRRGRIFGRSLAEKGTAACAFIDNNKNLQGQVVDGLPVIAPEQVSDYNFDKIYVSAGIISQTEDIFQQLDAPGVPADKIVSLLSSLNEYDEDTDPRILWLKNFALYAYEKNIAGAVAECGVFRGDFAEYINKYFHDRKMFLFDTFAGFAEKDINYEVGLSDDRFIGSGYNNAEKFSDTNEQLVLNRLLHPENCVIRKGYFPETAANIEEKFCFVNLDMDLYRPMLAGLDFFWARMNPGGVILLHDYFNPQLPGVSLAVADFEKKIRPGGSKNHHRRFFQSGPGENLRPRSNSQGRWR